MNPASLPATKDLKTNFRKDSPKKTYILGGVIWLLGWAAVYSLDAYLEPGNLAMLLILSSTLASICLPWRVSIIAVIGFVLMFDWFFIPPRNTFTIDFHQHALMLLVMLVVNIIIVSLMAIRRTQTQLAQRHAREAEILKQWSDRLLQSNTPQECLDELQHLLAELSGRDVVLLALKNSLPAQDDVEQAWLLGDAGIEQRHALWYCTRNNQQLGRGTGRYEMFLDVYLPLRAGDHALGAVLICNFAVHEFSTRVHLQAICDQFGHALERHLLQQQEANVREQAHIQLVRNNLLAAISHDYRTPLATIMGAASSLIEQTEKLAVAQQQQLAHRILDESERLNAITHNILQLARLDADKNIACDWQSAEEMMSDVLRRWRGRNLDHRLQINYESDSPLVWCDAVLIGQLLENLIDNAFKYSPADQSIKIDAYAEGSHFIFSVTDSGKGIAENMRDKIFQPFQRGQHNEVISGAGIGLALCRAIANAHAGEIYVESSGEGGSRFVVKIPNPAQPCIDSLNPNPVGGSA